MHIKDSPVKDYKTDFAGFELDATKIELHSTHIKGGGACSRSFPL